MTVQLLGAIDDLVSPGDNIDLVTGRDFIYLDVPHSGHVDVIELDETPAGRVRREIFLRALTASPEDLRKTSLLPGDPTLAQIRPDVTNVVFVVHGIRDAGYWTHKIARKVQSLGSVPPRIYSSETSTYGYFPMIPFLLPARRREKVEWLMDQFVEAKALYPNAVFSYVGHSNGTYLLAYALGAYRACRFSNVVFAGSVVRREYDWSAAISRGQVAAVLNYVATADWVVAWFPGALEVMGLQDLGTAGHNGFRQAQDSAGASLFERRYLPGQHSAGLAEENWDDIAYFIVHGEPRSTPGVALAARRNAAVTLVGRVAPVLWLAILALLAVVARGIWLQSWPEWQRTLALVAYTWIVWKILTWV